VGGSFLRGAAPPIPRFVLRACITLVELLYHEHTKALNVRWSKPLPPLCAACAPIAKAWPYGIMRSALHNLWMFVENIL
jgi:hypothetical protein